MTPSSQHTAFPLSIATSSLNPFPAKSEPPYDLVSKLRAISKAKFQAIELAFPDLLSFAHQHLGREVDDHDWDNLCIVAKQVQGYCKALGLEIMMLQPFGNFEGWRKDTEEGRTKREDAFERAKGWIRIMKELETDMLQVGSTDASDIRNDRNYLASDLAQLADMLADHNMRLAYENWCWATAASTWRDAYDLVVAADRSNIGLCLDTFQIAGGEWGDPTTESGRLEEISQSELEEQFQSSLKSLALTITPEKIYLLQVSDAYKPPKPLDPEPDDSGMRPSSRWSRAFRPIPGKPGGYLPAVEVAKAVKNTGFKGWFSIEVFDGGPTGEGRHLADMGAQAEEIMGLGRKFVEQVQQS